MLLGIVADVHANLAALEVTLAALQEAQVDHYLSLGDVVGYGPDPGACLDRLRRLPIDHIQGNHEARLLDLPTGRFNVVAEAAIQYTKETVNGEVLEFLRALPEQTKVGEDVLAVHGSMFDRDEYILSLQQMKVVLANLDEWLCLCGHTHQQYMFDGEELTMGPLVRKLDRGRRYLINPGSVGQPRDGDPRAAYAILDLETDELRLERAEYDVDLTAQRIQAAGLPDYLAERLWVGR